AESYSNSKLKFITEILSEFSPVKFYKEYVESYKSRIEAEADLLSHLKALSRVGKSREIRKAENYIECFDELINSGACNRYWSDKDNWDVQLAKKWA
ncbi:3129_t:CDS:1, partial [Diversispora eburnea]